MGGLCSWGLLVFYASMDNIFSGGGALEGIRDAEESELIAFQKALDYAHQPHFASITFLSDHSNLVKFTNGMDNCISWANSSLAWIVCSSSMTFALL